ncbi:PP2C family protein-serine/threonine phosphatase [Mycetocola spongiae]|uniref:PP2C family protein-serine/threonine phosphatase n=1 Tax=Mycetocola spongiae TaxID=2859226 RepID=UPI001CF4F724|nr:protein phosphatase 2C domain-containing protein [Mycetocola spongiae]UCR90383.1 protein phosphatase 2C domain-containing protein [Mycetocola spongiae]
MSAAAVPWSGESVLSERVSCEAAALSDAGRTRTRNEDSIAVGGPYFLVADGMGGYDAGDRASRAVTEAFLAGLPESAPATLDQVWAALEDARREVRGVAADTPRGAGSTVSGLILIRHEERLNWLLLNVGDSRVYQHVGSELVQLTADHSLRAEMIARGVTGDSPSLPARNIITRAIGSEESVPDSWLLPLVPGVRFLICTDGLHDELTEERIRAVLTMSGRPRSAVSELVRLANEAGGRDNISAIVVDVHAREGAPMRRENTSGGTASGWEHSVTATAEVRRTDD